jgi:hypothetical protein
MKPTGLKAPSARRLTQALYCSDEQATLARALIRGEQTAWDKTLFPIANAWFDQCVHKPKRIDRILSCLNECLKMHGVEPICDGGQRMDGSHIVAEYLNSGDTYTPTLVFNWRTRAFSLTTVGDFVERNRL